MAVNRNMFTVYDMMDAKGVFDRNPANVGARTEDGQSIYKGPQTYPRMLYHPEGKTRVLNPGTTELVAGQYMVLGRLEEIVHVIVNDMKEEAKYRGEGWHIHPAHAIAAGGGEAPMTSSADRIADLEAQIAALTAAKQETIDLSLPLEPLNLRKKA